MMRKGKPMTEYLIKMTIDKRKVSKEGTNEIYPVLRCSRRSVYAPIGSRIDVVNPLSGNHVTIIIVQFGWHVEGHDEWWEVEADFDPKMNPLDREQVEHLIATLRSGEWKVEEVLT